MELGSYFLFLQEQIKDIIIIILLLLLLFLLLLIPKTLARAGRAPAR
jgi:hypothetical protein